MNTDDESVSDAQRPEELRRFLREVKKGWTNTQIDAILRAKGYCEYCGADVLSSPEAFWGSVWAHLIPKSRGGENTYDANMALACGKCNSLVWQDLPPDRSIEELRECSRKDRVDSFRGHVLRRRQEEQVIMVFAAFRELVEIERCAGDEP